MKRNVVQKILCLVIALVMVMGLAACGGKTETDNGAKKDTTSEQAKTPEAAKPAEEAKPQPVTLKLLSNLPDRSAGQGKLEQLLIDNYMKENPNVKIEIETLQDEPYKQKFKAYTASNNLPDVYFVWGLPSFFNPVMKGGFAAELNVKDYESYGFFNGVLNGFSSDGKLFGLPRNTDMMVLYYNKEIFEKNGIKVPTTNKELIEVSKALRAKNIAPCAMNGKDKWAISILYHDFALKESGDPKVVINAVNRSTTFAKEEATVKAANDVKELMGAKFFQDSFTAADYGAARNMFGQGKSAMYYMGSWEMGMVVDESLPEAVRKNMAVARFPAVDGGKGKITDIMAWNGGGYAVSANSKVKEEALKFLNYIFKPENWSKNAWQLGLCIPAQKFDSFLTGKETDVQKELVKILNEATSTSGTTFNDLGSPSFKTDAETFSQELAAGVKTPEKFIEEVDKSADKSAGK